MGWELEPCKERQALKFLSKSKTPIIPLNTTHGTRHTNNFHKALLVLQFEISNPASREES